MADCISDCISAIFDWVDSKCKKLPPAVKSFFAIFLVCYIAFGIVCFPYGIYYLVKGTAIDYETLGTLQSAESFVISGNGGSSSYYGVKEIFAIQHNGVNSTCTLEQPTQYTFQGSADSEANSKVLGTVRDVFVMSYSNGVCIDENLKQYYTHLGLGLMIPSIPIWIVILFVCVCALFEACMDEGKDDRRSYSLPTSVNV